MKKRLTLIAALCLCLVLCACGKNKEAQAVDSMTDAITTVDASALPAVREAKAALEALSAEALADVEKGGKLYAMYDEIYAPLVVGQWCDPNIYLSNVGYNTDNVLDPSPLTINADHTYSWNYYKENHQGTWEICEDGLNLKDFLFLNLDVQDGKLVMHLDPNRAPLMTKDEYQAWISDMIMVVDVSEVNLEDYFSIVECENERYDEFNEPTGTVVKGFCLGNKQLENGWRYLAVDEDFAIEVLAPKVKVKQYRNKEAKGVAYTYNRDAGSVSFTYCPFGSYLDYRMEISSRGDREWDNYDADLTADQLSFGRAKGVLYFVNDKYISEVEMKMQHGYYQRMLHTTFSDEEVYGGGGLNIDY